MPWDGRRGPYFGKKSAIFTLCLTGVYFYYRQVIDTSAVSEMANITPSSASDKALLSLKTSPAYRIQMESHSISLPKYFSVFLREKDRKARAECRRREGRRKKMQTLDDPPHFKI